MWRPSLSPLDKPLFQALLDALADDVANGVLKPGDRLPPQRELAHGLGLGVGTVTRAYAEAERRGLIVGEVGRGSFVAGADGLDSGVIDMASNLPPADRAKPALVATLSRLSRRRDLLDQLGMAPPGGFEAPRRALAAWLGAQANWPRLDWRRVIVTAGAQQALAVAFGAICRPGDVVIAEPATFHGLKAVAARGDLRLVPAAMDGEGLTPDSLDRAAVESGARAVYVLPVQNPTTRVMSLARRQDLLAVAARRGLSVVEDDIYAPFAAALGLPPLAALAPERVWHATSLSKCLAPGLRTGCLIPPDSGMAEGLAGLRAIAFGAPTIGALIAADWIESGEAQALFAAISAELADRAALARRGLGDRVEACAVALPHLWLPMDELAAERFAGRALRGGVEVTPPRALFLEGAAVTGIRLCLGNAGDRATFERGLAVLSAALGPERAEARPLV